MNLLSLNNKIEERMKSFKLEDLGDYKNYLTPERANLVLNNFRGGIPYLYYQWLFCLMKEVYPTKVLELGAHHGGGSVVMLAGMPFDSTLYSVDINPDWRCVPLNEPRIVKIVGSDTNLSVYPPDLDFSTIDIWFIDSNHEMDYVKRQIDIFSNYWKKGTIVVMDDIDDAEFVQEKWGVYNSNHYVRKVWDELPYKKMELPHIHYSGFGFFVV